MRLLLLVSLFSCALNVRKESEDEVGEEQDLVNGTDGTPTISDAIAQMGVGINLGNTFDVVGQNPTDFYRTSRMIDLFKAGGFGHVRIPVTWGETMNSKGDAFVDAVTETVQYALNQGLWVIVNTHHEGWLKQKYDGSKYFDDTFYKLWLDIATHFQSFSHKLIFEVLNEPEGTMGSYDPRDPVKPDNQRAIELTRQINKVGYWAIRKVDANRLVMVSPNAQANIGQLSQVYGWKGALPGDGNDARIGVTVHTYDPWPCNGNDGNNSKCGSEQQMKDRVDGYVSGVEGWSRDKVPVHWGEFGFGREKNAEQRDTETCRQYYHEITRRILQGGMAPCVWDDQGWFAVTSGFDWVLGIKDAVMQGA